MADDLEERARRRVGTTLRGKWTLERLLGVGGMAAVYSARHRNASVVAVKMLHSNLSADVALRTRFLREGYIANTVAHPGIVRVLDDDVAEDGSAFFIMELLDGETAEGRQQRKGGRLTPEDVLSIADLVLSVLIAAHEKGVLHRDIKPENIFLCRDGKVRVLDFGIARLTQAGAPSTTQSGFVLGTPAFMAPEQALAKADEIDATTDLWSVGATMFMLLTGRPIHGGDTINEVLVRAATQRAPSLRELLPSVPSVVASVVDRAVAFEKRDRFPDAVSFQDAVRSAYHTLKGRLASDPPGAMPATFQSGDDEPTKVLEAAAPPAESSREPETVREPDLSPPRPTAPLRPSGPRIPAARPSPARLSAPRKSASGRRPLPPPDPDTSLTTARTMAEPTAGTKVLWVIAGGAAAALVAGLGYLLLDVVQSPRATTANASMVPAPSVTSMPGTAPPAGSEVVRAIPPGSAPPGGSADRP
jgi:eukaryotic-like serine/threonine-protein kinase